MSMYHTLLVNATPEGVNLYAIAESTGYNYNTLKTKASELGLGIRTNKVKQKLLDGKLKPIVLKDPLVYSWVSTTYPKYLLPVIPKHIVEDQPNALGNTKLLAGLLMTTRPTNFAQFASYHGYNLSTVKTYSSLYSDKNLHIAKVTPSLDDRLAQDYVFNDPKYAELQARLLSLAHNKALTEHLARASAELVTANAILKQELKTDEINKRTARIVKKQEKLKASIARRQEAEAKQEKKKQEDNERLMEALAFEEEILTILARITTSKLTEDQVVNIANRVGVDPFAVRYWQNSYADTDVAQLDEDKVRHYLETDGGYSIARTAKHFNTTIAKINNIL